MATTLTAALAVTACGSSSQARASKTSPIGLGLTPQATTSAPMASSVSNPTDNAAAGPATNYVIHYAAQDGTKVTVTFALHSAVHSSDATLPDWFPSGTPCQADPDRDAIIAGTLTATNETPDFKASIDMVIGAVSVNPPAGSSLGMGVAFSDSPRCINVNGLNSDDGPIVSPNFNGQSSWGPVSVEFIIRGAYTPANPLGDPAAIPSNLPMLTAWEGQPAASQQYGVASQSSSVEAGIQGNVYLNLTPLL